MKYDRMLNKAIKPTERQIETTIGSQLNFWKDIHAYLSKNYDYEPELVFFTKKYGWTIRYRKSGKTLCYFFPEEGAFSILIVLGEKEAEKVDLIKDQLNKKAIEIFESTEQLRDGKWMWMRILDQSDIDSLKLFIGAKKKPKNI